MKCMTYYIGYSDWQFCPLPPNCPGLKLKYTMMRSFHFQIFIIIATLMSIDTIMWHVHPLLESDRETNK
jgi:hypothetical protein